MFISKKKLQKYIEEIKKGNRARTMQNYNHPISEKQQVSNAYWQGYEDGTDNFYNAVCAKFKIGRERK